MQPTCKQCEYIKLKLRCNMTANNRGIPRAGCECMHPNAVECFHKVCPKSNRQPGFIGFTEKGGDEPTLKTSPRWCPLRPENKNEEL